MRSTVEKANFLFSFRDFYFYFCPDFFFQLTCQWLCSRQGAVFNLQNIFLKTYSCDMFFFFITLSWKTAGRIVLEVCTKAELLPRQHQKWKECGDMGEKNDNDIDCSKIKTCCKMSAWILLTTVEYRKAQFKYYAKEILCWHSIRSTNKMVFPWECAQS